MNRTLVNIVGTLVPIAMAIFCGYMAWIIYLSFYDSAQRLLWNWGDFDFIVFFVWVSGWLIGLISGILLMMAGIASEASKKREREKLKEEIKKELKAEKQPPPPES